MKNEFLEEIAGLVARLEKTGTDALAIDKSSLKRLLDAAGPSETEMIYRDALDVFEPGALVSVSVATKALRELVTQAAQRQELL